MGGAQAREAEAVSLDLLGAHGLLVVLNTLLTLHIATLSRPRYMDQKNTSTRIRPA
ncbi:hypothetical protein CALCODRAFT_504965 [Calocera cornea HHB12733]|uniref:Uncharacterized protein n=1 Tax=Calocera cornea HHB12733 TaxID=1353952 RepID=A0A165C3T6_9BASI|nr:hypothetical protein CALCODRAFT_504965 [Calocera cornea HHB12733]